IQRDGALAALGQALNRAASMADALQEALAELHRFWDARQVVAASWTGAAEPSLTASVPGLSWPTLPEATRAALTRLRGQPPLTPDAAAGGAGIALEHPSGTLAIWIDLGAGRALSVEDQTLLSLLCGRLGPALHRAHQIDEQRETALALQRAILGPARLPAGFSARYEPATRPLEVGGDWHDVIELPDGRIAIVVGDCVGHDLGAATVMGQLRSACRALLLQDASVGRVLAAMDRFAASVPGAEYTTVFCAILDPVTGRLTYAAAGHPPGIVARPDGGIDLLEGARSVPLAAAPQAARGEAGYVLPPRSTLLLYTDGARRTARPLADRRDRRGGGRRRRWQRRITGGSRHPAHGGPRADRRIWRRRGRRAVPASRTARAGVPRRHRAAQTGPGATAPLAGRLRAQHPAGPGRPGGGRGSGGQRDRARPPRQSGPGDPAASHRHREPAAADRRRHRPLAAARIRADPV